MTLTPGNIDPRLTLALSLYNTRGGYALLLGSGLSTAAGVPTGWEIVLDLVRRVATAESPEAAEAAERDAESWYQRRFERAPSYSDLIGRLAPTASERRELLRGYMEPTATDREEGRRKPTLAHRAVARLVREGYVKVILTTNFDQLAETALREEGVSPAVIATPDQVEGMMPLHLERVTLIKLHGDYFDTRIKNIEEELASYSQPFNALLDRVFDEYGLIVCGWSGAWDHALRAAIERCPSRRFTTFWATRGEQKPETLALIAHRRAEVIEIEDADKLFVDVSEKLAALASMEQQHPLTTPLAVAALKRYLPTPEHRIRMRDLVIEEAERTARRASPILRSGGPIEPVSLVQEVIRKIEVACETLNALMATGAYWEEQSNRFLWVEVLDRLGNQSAFDPLQGGLSYELWLDLYRYPAQLAFYAAGVAACARGKSREDLVADLLLLPRIKFGSNRKADRPVDALNAWEAVQPESAQAVFNTPVSTPASQRLFEVLRPSLLPMFADEEAYADAFDRWEYLIALVHCDRKVTNPEETFSVPTGRFFWRRRGDDGRSTMYDAIAVEVKGSQADWFLLRRGLFGGSPQRVLSLMVGIEQSLARRRAGTW
jgi:hypothetical protein